MKYLFPVSKRLIKRQKSGFIRKNSETDRWGYGLAGQQRGDDPASKKDLDLVYATQPFLLTFAPDLKNTLCK
jgi:hypothetical protein